MLLVFGSTGGVGQTLLQHFADHPAAGAPYGSIVGVSRTDCDVTVETSVAEYVAGICADMPAGEPFYIINATGLSTNAMLHKMSLPDFEATLRVNLTAAFLLVKHFQPVAKTRPGSSLLLLSSVVATIGVPGTIAYAASKAGIHGLVRTAARELARIQARVNCIDLGYFDMGLIKQVPPDLLSTILQSVPLARLGTGEELFHACDFALRNSYLTGSTLKLNGGMV